MPNPNEKTFEQRRVELALLNAAQMACQSYPDRDMAILTVMGQLPQVEIFKIHDAIDAARRARRAVR